MAAGLQRIIVDLTPVRPGGDNGGAKIVARALVRELSQLAPGTQFTLLTSAASHAELADLDAANVQRQAIDTDLAAATDTPVLHGARAATRVLINSLVPSAARQQLKDSIWTMLKRERRRRATSARPADLLFCPFTAPFFFDARVSLVSVVHDLQFLDYPEFFDDEQRRGRLAHFQDACAKADRLICVSDFVRRTVLQHGRVPAERVQTIHSAVLHASQPTPHAGAVARGVLDRLGIARSRFLLYPANPWPHKNHAVLLRAFSAYLQAQPAADLALVCTGAPEPAAEALVTQAQHLLPAGTFGFAGYLSEPEYAALLQTCRALIFPSLYEGFGLALLEAMAQGRPVLCSNATSLPEVAGDAALLFDPRDPGAIAAAIGRLEGDPGLEARLIECGHRRAAHFGTARSLAAKYLAVFEDVVRRRSSV